MALQKHKFYKSFDFNIIKNGNFTLPLPLKRLSVKTLIRIDFSSCHINYFSEAIDLKICNSAYFSTRKPKMKKKGFRI